MTGVKNLPCYVCEGRFPTTQYTVRVVERDEDGNPTKIVHRQGRCRLVHDGKLASYDDSSRVTAPQKIVRNPIMLRAIKQRGKANRQRNTNGSRFKL